MRVNGQWLLCDDGVVRPVIPAQILTGISSWQSLELLVDTGADRTVLSANVLGLLQMPHSPSVDRFSGVGGVVDTVAIRTQLRLHRDDGIPMILRGEYALARNPISRHEYSRPRHSRHVHLVARPSNRPARDFGRATLLHDSDAESMTERGD